MVKTSGHLEYTSVSTSSISLSRDQQRSYEEVATVLWVIPRDVSGIWRENSCFIDRAGKLSFNFQCHDPTWATIRGCEQALSCSQLKGDLCAALPGYSVAISWVPLSKSPKRCSHLQWLFLPYSTNKGWLSHKLYLASRFWHIALVEERDLCEYITVITSEAWTGITSNWATLKTVASS